MTSSEQSRHFHRTPIQVRFADTDAIGHINNASFALYAEQARLHFMRDLKEDVRSIILAHVDIDYRRQVLFEQEVHVETFVEKVGNSSFTLRHVVRANGELAAEMRSVVVQFDYASQQSMPLGESLRAKLLARQAGMDPEAAVSI